MLSIRCVSPVTGRHQAWPEISMSFPNRRGEEAMATTHPNQRSERRFCAAIRSAPVWPLALAALVFATASSAEDARKGAVPEKEVQAKLQYCKVCHGVSAQGFRGFYPIPRLAGQQPTYLENQL